jgi:hypothetical protein
LENSKKPGHNFFVYRLKIKIILCRLLIVFDLILDLVLVVVHVRYLVAGGRSLGRLVIADPDKPKNK